MEANKMLEKLREALEFTISLAFNIHKITFGKVG